jgi:hypothetical protein
MPIANLLYKQVKTDKTYLQANTCSLSFQHYKATRSIGAEVYIDCTASSINKDTLLYLALSPKTPSKWPTKAQITHLGERQ